MLSAPYMYYYCEAVTVNVAIVMLICGDVTQVTVGYECSRCSRSSDWSIVDPSRVVIFPEIKISGNIPEILAKAWKL